LNSEIWYLNFGIALQQAAREPLEAVILSAAKNPGICSDNELRRSFLRSTQDRLRLLRMTLKELCRGPLERGR